jgi:uncharacterized protein (TIGR02996 family)
MPTEAELLAAIDANMDDDAPRLAHADWLEQNGDSERAEFIRLQMRHEGQPFGGAEDEAGHERQHVLYEKNQKRWLGRRPTAEGLAWNFTRGYPDLVAFGNLDVFDKHWERVFEFPVRWVVFRGVRSPARLAKSPGLARIRGLLVYDVGEVGVLTILQSPHLGQLEGLEVQGGNLTERTLSVIASSPKFARLRELTLVGSRRCDPGAFASFIASPNLAGLRRLGLYLWGLNAASVAPLWEREWPALVALTLTNNPLGPNGLVGLGDGARFANLEALALSVAYLGDEEAAALARAIRLTRLHRLELNNNSIGEAGARALASAAHLAGLEVLALKDNAINDGGAEALAGSRHLGNVVSLNLRENMIADVGMRALGRSETLSSLRHFYGHGNPARPELSEQVADRFHKGLPPIPDEAPSPPTPLPADAAAIGHADEDGLVRAVWADPNDNVARSVYADWLEEHGSPLQAELLRSPAGNRGEFVEALAASVVGTLHAGDKATLMQEDGLLGVSMSMRGFLSKRFEAEGPAWMRRHHIARIRLSGQTKDWRRVGDAPVTRHLRGLCLGATRITNEGVEQLAASEGLTGLASLGLRQSPLSLPGIRAIANSLHLARLCHLDLTLVFPTVEGMRALCEGPMASSLRCLMFTASHLDDVCAAVLAQSPALAGLVTLGLAGNQFHAPGAQALAASPHLTGLRNLELAGTYIGDTGLDALAGSPLLARLRLLTLTALSLSDAALSRFARAVAATPHCRLRIVGPGRQDVFKAEADILGERLILE